MVQFFVKINFVVLFALSWNMRWDLIIEKMKNIWSKLQKKLKNSSKISLQALWPNLTEKTQKYRNWLFLVIMECYATQLGLWGRVRNCRNFKLPLPPSCIFSHDLANKACPFALHACRHKVTLRAWNVNKGGRCKLQLPQVKFKMFEISPSSYKKEAVENHYSFKAHQF